MVGGPTAGASSSWPPRRLPGRCDRPDGRLEHTGDEPVHGGDLEGGLGQPPGVVAPVASSTRTSPGRRQGPTTGVLSRGRPEWFVNRGPGYVLSKIHVPTLIVQGTADNLFPLDEGAQLDVSCCEERGPHAMAWFCGGHGCASTGDPNRYVRTRSFGMARPVAGARTRRRRYPGSRRPTRTVTSAPRTPARCPPPDLVGRLPSDRSTWTPTAAPDPSPRRQPGGPLGGSPADHPGRPPTP